MPPRSGGASPAARPAEQLDPLAKRRHPLAKRRYPPAARRYR